MVNLVSTRMLNSFSTNLLFQLVGPQYVLVSEADLPQMQNFKLVDLHEVPINPFLQSEKFKNVVFCFLLKYTCQNPVPSLSLLIYWCPHLWFRELDGSPTHTVFYLPSTKSTWHLVQLKRKMIFLLLYNHRVKNYCNITHGSIWYTHNPIHYSHTRQPCFL